MGSNMVRRLMGGGHHCVVYDRDPAEVARLAAEGATGTGSLDELIGRLTAPRAVWLMVPAAAVDGALAELGARLLKDDVVIDGGNSYYVDDIRRSRELAPKGIHYLDVGTSGGVFGLERGFSLMAGGEREIFDRLAPILRTLAPGRGTAERTPGREKAPESTAEEGFLWCGPAGAGHFVKMVHNGIEYGMMASFAEGLNILKHADAGAIEQKADAETTPMRNPDLYRYRFDLGEVAEVWRRGSVIASWLLDLTAASLLAQPDLTAYKGSVADSGEGRWTLAAAIEESVPAPVLSAALFQRFSSRGESDFANKLLSAMRAGFGGHAERR
jgi:6-phosphogluconate dehydrogenase